MNPPIKHAVLKVLKSANSDLGESSRMYPALSIKFTPAKPPCRNLVAKRHHIFGTKLVNTDTKARMSIMTKVAEYFGFPRNFMRTEPKIAPLKNKALINPWIKVV